MDIKISDKTLRTGEHIRIYISSPDEAKREEIFHYQVPCQESPDGRRFIVTGIEIGEAIIRGNMIDIIEEVELERVSAATDGFPFICPACGQEHRDWDYLRIHLKGNPNPLCIHLLCLLAQVGFSPEEIKRASQ